MSEQLDYHCRKSLTIGVCCATTALGSPCGTAHLSIPVNLFRAEAPPYLAYPYVPQLLTQTPSLIDLKALDELCKTFVR